MNYCSEHGNTYYQHCTGCIKSWLNGEASGRIGQMTTTDPSKMIGLPVSSNKLEAFVHADGTLTYKDAVLRISDAKAGVKHDQGKPRMDLISYPALEQLAQVLEFGAGKYEPWNWAKGIDYSRVIGAVERHIGKWKNRQDLDDETNLSHLAHAMCGLMFLLDYVSRDLKHLDDRRPLDTVKPLDKKSETK